MVQPMRYKLTAEQRALYETVMPPIREDGLIQIVEKEMLKKLFPVTKELIGFRVGQLVRVERWRGDIYIRNRQRYTQNIFNNPDQLA